MTAIWRAPGRVNLIGEHTDYNGGFVLPIAITPGCTASVRTIDVPELRISSAQRAAPVTVGLAGLSPGAVSGWAAYPAGSAWAVRAAGVAITGLDIHIDGDVPVGAGLSSSAAVVCSVAAAVAENSGAELDRATLVAVARRAENEFVGAPTGGMDQLVSVQAVAGHALLCDMRSLQIEPVPFDPAADGLSLVVIDSRAPHRNVDGAYGERRRTCEQAARVLGVAQLRDVTAADWPEAELALRRAGDQTLVRRARHVVTEDERVLDTARLLREGRLREIGPHLSASHASMRDDFEITVAEVDTAVAVAQREGALGARMTGGGFGGCVIALVPVEAVAPLTDAVTAEFARRRFAPPVVFEAEAGPGAHRLTPG